jgi:hypothetical protein
MSTADHYSNGVGIMLIVGFPAEQGRFAGLDGASIGLAERGSDNRNSERVAHGKESAHPSV